jgi:hypothetical protein
MYLHTLTVVYVLSLPMWAWPIWLILRT